MAAIDKKYLEKKMRRMFKHSDLQLSKKYDVHFRAWSPDGRQVADVYLKNSDSSEKMDSYRMINQLLNGFDFSWRIDMDKQQLRQFLSTMRGGS